MRRYDKKQIILESNLMVIHQKDENDFESLKTKLYFSNKSIDRLFFKAQK